jgi:molybdenum cofactor biosynthesis enzyme MoaA
MCPRGQEGHRNPDKGLMSFDLFQRIVDKLHDEEIRVKRIWIGNWGEPLLNPDLAQMISYLKSKDGVLVEDSCIVIHTTLNNLKNPSALINSGVDTIRVTISGMTQEVYSRNHKGGNIETVLRNITELAELNNMKQHGKVELILAYHFYVYNMEQVGLAVEFCQKHGLIFQPIRTYVPCVEAGVKFHGNNEEMSEYYENFIDVQKEMSYMRTIDYKDIPECWLLKDHVTINFDGQLYRCCGVFDKENFLGSVFDYKIKDIPQIESAICKTCAETPLSWR